MIVIASSWDFECLYQSDLYPFAACRPAASWTRHFVCWGSVDQSNL